jgi:hypothetical protein
VWNAREDNPHGILGLVSKVPFEDITENLEYPDAVSGYPWTRCIEYLPDGRAGHDLPATSFDKVGHIIAKMNDNVWIERIQVSSDDARC